MKKIFPLINFAPFELTRRTCIGGGISLKGLLLLPAYYLQIIPTLPLALMQFILFRNKIEKTIIRSDPVFILGHYRTGTSLLQKLMASDKNFGFLSYYDALFPNTGLLFGKSIQSVFQKLVNRFKIKNPFFHETVLQLKEPDEEDDYLINKGSAYAAYWGFIFPKRWREWLNGSTQMSDQNFLNSWKKEYLTALKYITFRNQGKQLVLKNPPNTERISILLELFPQAKFIFIYRNPFYLYYSIRNMWKKAILGYYSVQKLSEEELDEIVFGHFEYLMEQYEKEKHLIPEGNLTQVSYEDLKADPFLTVQKIYSDIHLPGFEQTTRDLLAQIESEKTYQSFQHQISQQMLTKIEERWGKYIRLWNYTTPKGLPDSHPGG